MPLLRVLRMLLIFALFNLSGCFYLVQEGKGGVAERFPISQEQQTLSIRLHACDASLKELTFNGMATRNPALYQEIVEMLNESHRLYEAEYYPQASETLVPVEQMLELIQQNMHVKTASSLCEQQPYTGVCL